MIGFNVWFSSRADTIDSQLICRPSQSTDHLADRPKCGHLARWGNSMGRLGRLGDCVDVAKIVGGEIVCVHVKVGRLSIFIIQSTNTVSLTPGLRSSHPPSCSLD